MEDKKRKAAAAAAVATIIGASSTAIEANFNDPADLLQSTNVEPKVQHIEMGDDQDSDAAQNDEDKKGAKTGKLTFRDFILGFPLTVRVLFVLPQWFIGSGIVFLGGLLFSGMSPVLRGILSFVLLALVIAGAFTLTAKAMFPDLPLGKILNRHSIKWILIAAVAVYAADLVLGIFGAGYAHFKTVITGAMTLLAMGGIAVWFARKEKRRRSSSKSIGQQLEKERLQSRPGSKKTRKGNAAGNLRGSFCRIRGKHERRIEKIEQRTADRTCGDLFQGLACVRWPLVPVCREETRHGWRQGNMAIVHSDRGKTREGVFEAAGQGGA